MAEENNNGYPQGVSPENTIQQHPLTDEVVQVVYQSNEDGQLVEVESTSLITPTTDEQQQQQYSVVRAVSALPSVAEESSSGPSHSAAAPIASTADVYSGHAELTGIADHEDTSRSVSRSQLGLGDYEYATDGASGDYEPPIEYYTQSTSDADQYATINKGTISSNYHNPDSQTDAEPYEIDGANSSSLYTAIYAGPSSAGDSTTATLPFNYQQVDSSTLQTQNSDRFLEESDGSRTIQPESADKIVGSLEYAVLPPENPNEENTLVQFDGDEISKVKEYSQQESRETEESSSNIARSKSGAAESGSFRQRKSNPSLSHEYDLSAQRQRLIDLQQSGVGLTEPLQSPAEDQSIDEESKFKRTHSVSFNVSSRREPRHSVDIRNLPSYLNVKRASIVDVARGAMSSLFGSFGSGEQSSEKSSMSALERRDSVANSPISPIPVDEGPIFEEPVAPTLSLGQRVAHVRHSGTEFGTVGWIGQFAQVEDDWVVGVIFDNPIGDCDGAYQGQRYFYARDGYAMFVPLSVLTKTDNYIGRPETGTMLSRMSVCLKPGQMISIQRSSIRLQHCFLNAPHQRVGHDVRAVSNRLHCQCHNCGPCAHLSKQGRGYGSALLAGHGAHHMTGHHRHGAGGHGKKNSLAHAAVELLAHHHHHFHEEEEGTEHGENADEYHQFGENSAHACNYVRYSCCQQNGVDGHEFSADCGMVRPELLDNLIHAPRAPARRSRPRHLRNRQKLSEHQTAQSLETTSILEEKPPLQPIEINSSDMEKPNVAELAPIEESSARATAVSIKGDERVEQRDSDASFSSDTSDDEGSLSPARQELDSDQQLTLTGKMAPLIEPFVDYYQHQSNALYSTLDSHISLRDQRHFIAQRDSSAFMTSRATTTTSYASYRTGNDYDNYDDYDDSSQSNRRGFVSSFRRCLGCLIGRNNGSSRRRSRRRSPKRKLSARNRMIEYRRKQSTFVPSTLAKPQEDFASHGIILPGAQFGAIPRPSNGSEYSSSRSGSNSSASSSPRYQEGVYVVNPSQGDDPYYSYGPFGQDSIVYEGAGHEYQLKSRNAHEPDDFYMLGSSTTDLKRDIAQSGSDTYNKSGFSRDSALTDLGTSDSCNSDSGSLKDTLKKIVDSSVNDLEPPLTEIQHTNYHDQQVFDSPLTLTERASPQDPNLSGTSDRLAPSDLVSSPTVSLDDGSELCHLLDCLQPFQAHHDSDSQSERVEHCNNGTSDDNQDDLPEG